MSWRLAVGVVIGVVGAIIAWFFGSLAWIAVPRENCDWLRDPQEIMCSDNGPLYWAFFAGTVAVTGLVLWLLRPRRNRD